MPPLPINVGDKQDNEKGPVCRAQEPSWLKLLILFAVAAVIVFDAFWETNGLLHKLRAGNPSTHGCSHTNALDDRARCILSTTPLIGKHFLFSNQMFYNIY